MPVKKIIEKIVEVIKPKKVEVVKTEEICTNCNNSGLQCHVCSVPFSDTFGI